MKNPVLYRLLPVVALLLSATFSDGQSVRQAPVYDKAQGPTTQMQDINQGRIKGDVPTGSKLSGEQAQAALRIHNNARANLGIPSLEWSAALAAYAQEWADYLASHGCGLDHRSELGENRLGYGENLYWSIGRPWEESARNACESWMEEKEEFKNLPIGSETQGTGHYSQIIWSNSKHLGMGIAKCADGAIIIVANYDPPGNYIGETAY